MKKLSLPVAAGIISLLMSFSILSTTEWSADTTHSHLGFTINHLGIADIHGSFGAYEAVISSSKADFSDASVSFTGEISSINTNNQMRDEHLKGADFFDATKFPKFEFKSSSFTRVKGNNFLVKGNLTLHGVTKPVILNAVLNGTTVHPMTKKEMSGFKVTGKIKRTDFGIGNGFPAPMLSDEVKITADIEFSKN